MKYTKNHNLSAPEMRFKGSHARKPVFMGWCEHQSRRQAYAFAFWKVSCLDSFIIYFFYYFHTTCKDQYKHKILNIILV